MDLPWSVQGRIKLVESSPKVRAGSPKVRARSIAAPRSPGAGAGVEPQSNPARLPGERGVGAGGPPGVFVPTSRAAGGRVGEQGHPGTAYSEFC